MTGIAHSRGEFIFLIDCDLEEEPEIIKKFWDELESSRDVDVVYGLQRKRQGKLPGKILGYLFYKIFNFFSEYKLPENLVMTRLMRRRYVDNLIKHKETDLMIAGLFVLTGFKQKGIHISKKHKGKSTYNLKRKIDIIVNAITSFSSKPLVYIFYIGMIILLISVVMIANLIAKKIFFGIPIQGWASLIVSIWFFGGLVVFCIGTVGIYLSKVFNQVKGRPYTIVKRIYSK
jgi:putative glycosyltransferase